MGNTETPKTAENSETEPKEIYIKVTNNGPYLVYGMPEISQKTILADENNFGIEYGDGKVFEIITEPVALCRCGKTKNPPFCDGSHIDSGFDGTETASFEPILESAIKHEGPNLTLADNEKLCAFARFCDAQGGIWNLIKEGTEASDAVAVKEANLCPAGRLIILDKEGKILEENLPKSIALLDDDGLKISGPLWLRGGIRVESADGKSYEVRNRQTICRCGESKNKPFCDCSHRQIIQP